MNGHPDEDVFRSMICSFQINDLLALLGGAHNPNISSDVSELKNWALELLRSRPEGFDHISYQNKIYQLYYSRLNDSPNYDEIIGIIPNQGQQQHMMSINTHQPRIYQGASPNNPQQSMHISRGGLPQVIPQMQRGMHVSNIPGNNIQYSYQPAVPRNLVPHVSTNQEVNAVGIDHLQYDMSKASTFTPPAQHLGNIKLKNLPYYEVISDVIKPITLVGQERRLNPSKAMREEIFKINMSVEQVNCISVNRDIITNEYIFELQIRICLFEPTSTEITDFFPLELKIKINNDTFPLPPTPKTPPGTEARKIAIPINCSNLLKLNPSLLNTITVNWVPDAKTYVMAVYLVKHLSASILLQRLTNKEARSSVETKNYIIKSLTVVDPDVCTTSYRFSLLCPLGKTRMKIPAKSINCDHLQCFDANLFILMNEKNPSWLCPTCSKPCLYDDIQIQTYFLEVVSSPSLPDSCKEIEILPDGTWKIYEENKDLVESVANKVTLIDSINLDSDDENSMDVTKEANSVSSNNKEFENVKKDFIHLTLTDEEPLDDDDNQETEILPATTRDSKSQPQ